MDALYKHLRDHFTALAVKVDCNQVSCTFKIQDVDEKLSIARANMIDLDYNSNQLQKSISSMKSLQKSMQILSRKCNDAVQRCNALWKLLPSSPRSLPVFESTSKHKRVLMEGAMTRLGTYFKGSKNRWVILYTDGLMAYYNEDQSELKGVIDLMNATEVIPSDISHLMITVKKRDNKLRSWHFKCPSPQQVTQWLDAIRSLHFIKARSKLRYSENVPAQFLRDNTRTVPFMKDKIQSDTHCAFGVMHLFGIHDCYCCELSVYSDGRRLNVVLRRSEAESNSMMKAFDHDTGGGRKQIEVIDRHQQQSQHPVVIQEEEEYIDWNAVRKCFDNDNNDGHCLTTKLSYLCSDIIISIQIASSLEMVLFATTDNVYSIAISDLMQWIEDETNIDTERVETLIEIKKDDDKQVERIKVINDIQMVQYRGLCILFICDSIQHCLWCFHLEERCYIRLINTPSPNGVTVHDDTLYITSLQCGVYWVELKSIDFDRAFSSPSFCSPFSAKTLSVFENIVLKEITAMALPPLDLRAPETPPLAMDQMNLGQSQAMRSNALSSSPAVSVSSTHSFNSNGSMSHNSLDRLPTNTLFVIDIECTLWMIRLSDLVLITFGVIECGHKLFYDSNLDQLYITRPCEHRIDCISNIYHEIVAVRSCASNIFTPNPQYQQNHNDADDLEMKEDEHSNHSNSTPNSGYGLTTSSVERSISGPLSSMNLSNSMSLQKVNAVDRSQSEPTRITTTKLKDGNHRNSKSKENRSKRREHHNHRKKVLSNEDIRAILMQQNDGNDTRNGIRSLSSSSNSNQQQNSKKICFPKSLYLIYTKSKDDDMMEQHNVNENDAINNCNADNIDNVEMEVLCELDNMLQSYMLSELRLHSKRLLSYLKRNYSFLYLYTSPYDAQSTYRELDANYESSVPAKNLIQHSSIGPVILVKLKPPTKEQIRKQKEKEVRAKKKRKKKQKLLKGTRSGTHPT